MLCQYSVKAYSDALLQNHFIYVTGTSGEAGSTAELTLNIHNNNPINYWKCDLILPEGFTLKSAAPVKDRWPEEYDPIITTNANDDGSVTIFNNFNNDAEDVSLTGTDGPVATVTVDIANTVSSGKYTITLRNIYLEEPNGTIIWKEYTEFKWTIMGESIPFVEEGKVWNMYYHNDLAHETYPTYHYKYFI